MGTPKAGRPELPPPLFDSQSPRSPCPTCGAHGIRVDATPGAETFVCPVCQFKWQRRTADDRDPPG